MLTDDMGKITKKYETNSGHILSAALTVVIIVFLDFFLPASPAGGKSLRSGGAALRTPRSAGLPAGDKLIINPL